MLVFPSVPGTAKHAVARSMDLHRIVALQTYLAAQVSQTLRCVSVGFRNVKIRYLMHAPLSHGENALDKGRGDHIMATVRSISESRVIQLSIFSDTRSEEKTSELQSLMRISYAAF